MKVIWFAVDCNVYTHPKVLDLAQLLSIDVDTLVGKLGRLWSWAMLSGSETGEMPHMPEQEIADIMRYKKPAKKLVAAMLQCGLIDITGETLYIHDWTELNGGFAEKKRKERERKSGITSAEIPRKFCGASADTVPNRTIPYPTIPNSFDVFGGHAGGRDDSSGFLAELDEYFGVDEATKRQAAEIADKLFSAHTTRKPTQTDTVMVFVATRLQKELPDKSWEVTFPQDSVDLLEYAFKQAVSAGCPGNWRYINGVSALLCQRGIKTLNEAENYDFERKA
ncbi:MAG: DnaD domain protein [Oscillospiraceae bacterium]